jgi:hypothetical protein
MINSKRFIANGVPIALIVTINVAALILIATIIKFGLNILLDDGLGYDYPASSMAQSQQTGVFASIVKIDPKSFPFQNYNIVFGEAWVEREVKTTHPFIWFSRLTFEGNYFLCFTLAGEKNIFIPRSANQPFFTLGVGEPGSFTNFSDGKLFYHEISSGNFADHDAEGCLVRESPNLNGPPLRFTW